MNQNSSLIPIPENQNILFVSDLPTNTTEEDLLIFFKNYHVSMVKIHISKSNIFAYVYFENFDYASKARRELNGEVLIPKYAYNGLGKPVRICKYEPKNQILENIKDSSKSLLIKNVDSSITAKDFYQLFEEFGEVKSSKLEVDDKGYSKNYGYIHYNDAKCAEFARQKLNGKLIKGKKLEIVNLIPSRSKENTRNNLYIKNFPLDFCEEDLERLFFKFGEITSCIISRDDKGVSRGFGFVCFSNALNALQAQKELNEKNVTFPGLPPLYISFAMKKEDRVAQLSKEIQSIGDFKFIASFSMMDLNLLISTEMEKELRLFIKVILLQEYSPKKIEVMMNKGIAIVYMNSAKDLKEFFKKYSEYTAYNIPTFLISPWLDSNQVPSNINQQFQPIINQFSNMSLMNPTQVPYQNEFANNPQFMPPNVYVKQYPNTTKNPRFPNFNPSLQNNNFQNFSNVNFQPNNKGQFSSKQNVSEDSNSIEDVAAQIYEFVEKKYPIDAGKITGMIVDLGMKKMSNLLTQPEKLFKVVDEAYQMLKNQS